MNINHFLEVLSKTGGNPNCIWKTRQVIVALAVTGHLDNRDETFEHSDLLEGIENIKSHLVKCKIIPKQKIFNDVTAEELPEAFHDPSRFVKLGKIARIEKGLTGIKKALPGQFPLVVTGAERNTCDHFDFDGAAAIIPLVSSTGHGHASINRLHYQDGQFALGTILAAVFPHDPKLTSPRFIFEYLTSFKQELLVTRMSGTANVTLSIGRIAEVPIPLISPKAQQKVDELMDICDRLETAAAISDKIRQHLLEALLHEALASNTRHELKVE